MNRYEQVRHDAHEVACETLAELNRIERVVDADADSWLHAPDRFADVKRQIAEVRAFTMSEYRLLLAVVDAKEKEAAG